MCGYKCESENIKELTSKSGVESYERIKDGGNDGVKEYFLELLASYDKDLVRECSMLYDNISSKCDEKNIQNFNDFIYERPIAEML